MSTGKSSTVYQRISGIISHLGRNLYERDEVLRLSLLAALSGQSIFYLGPPGVAKSMVARRISLAFENAEYFEYLMGRFSTPDELFGPVSISRLKHEDRYSRNTTGFLPDADIVFLDEIWKASPPIQNTLLSALNERIFRNGDEIIRLPLKCFIAASNSIAESDETRAFWDRFLIRLVIDPIEDDENFGRLIAGEQDGDSPDADALDIGPAPDQVKTEEWESWRSGMTGIILDGDSRLLFAALRSAIREKLPEHGELYVSDRRWKMVSALMRSSAYLHGRNETSLSDAFLIPHCIWNGTESRAEVQELFDRALGTSAFASLADVDSEKANMDDFIRRIDRAAFEEVDARVLSPVRYDGEYLQFIPDREIPDRSYRIWFDDLENLDERGELEFFIHEKGNFLATEIHGMKWKDRSAWTLQGDLGDGRIECREVNETRREEKPLTAAVLADFQKDYSGICSRIEEKITAINKALDVLTAEAEKHLFIPRSDMKAVKNAAEHRSSELELLLADLMDIGRSRGLE